MELNFPGSSDGKESTCNVGDMGLIAGLGRSPGGGIDLHFESKQKPFGA